MLMNFWKNILKDIWQTFNNESLFHSISTYEIWDI